MRTTAEPGSTGSADDKDRSGQSEPVVGEVPGWAEVSTVAWPLLLRRRVQARVEASNRYRWWVLWSVLTGLFAAGFGFTILAVSIPEIADDLGASETAVTWVVAGPMVMFAVAMPLLGKLGDLYGHRRVYLIGMSLFVVSTGLSALAWNAASLIGIRTLAAVEGAATGPAAMALINRAFPPSDRVKAMGFFSLVAAGAPVIGLVAGGVLVETFGWRALFITQLPLGMLAFGLNAVVLRETPRKAGVSLDLRGAASVALAAVSALLLLDRGTTLGWGHPMVLAMAAAVPLALWSFLSAERRAPDPLIPLEFFGRRNFSFPLVAQFFANIAYMGGFIISPLLMQHVFGYTVAASALVMLWRPLTFSVTAPAAGYAATRVGERAAAVVGTSLIAVSMLALAHGATGRSLGFVVFGLVLSGIGMGVASPSLQASVANAVDEEDLGIASAAQQMVFMIGASAGIQILKTVQGDARVAAPFADAYLVGFALALVGVVGAVFVRSLDREASVRVAAAA